MFQEKDYLLEILVRLTEEKFFSKQGAAERSMKSEKAETLERAVAENSLSPHFETETPADTDEAFSAAKESFSVSYSVHGGNFIDVPVSYAPLCYQERGGTSAAYQLQDEDSAEIREKGEPEEIITIEEGEELVQEVQYATVVGSKYDIDPEELRKLDLRLKLEPSLLTILTTNALTNDVNYAPWM